MTDLTPTQAAALSKLLAAHTDPDPALLELLPAEPDPRLTWSAESWTRSVRKNGKIWFRASIQPRGNVFVDVDIPNQTLTAEACILTATKLLDAAAGLEGWSAHAELGAQAGMIYLVARRNLRNIRHLLITN